MQQPHWWPAQIVFGKGEASLSSKHAQRNFFSLWKQMQVQDWKEIPNFDMEMTTSWEAFQVCTKEMKFSSPYSYVGSRRTCRSHYGIPAMAKANSNYNTTTSTNYWESTFSNSRFRKFSNYHS